MWSWKEIEVFGSGCGKRQEKMHGDASGEVDVVLSSFRQQVGDEALQKSQRTDARTTPPARGKQLGHTPVQRLPVCSDHKSVSR